MRIDAPSPTAVPPVSAAPDAGHKGAGSHGDEQRLAEKSPLEMRPGTALVVAERPGAERPEDPRRTWVAAPVVAQVIAQSMPVKSDRRIARLFPERALGAYRTQMVAAQSPAVNKLPRRA
jgi:hypothetical protein